MNLRKDWPFGELSGRLSIHGRRWAPQHWPRAFDTPLRVRVASNLRKEQTKQKQSSLEINYHSSVGKGNSNETERKKNVNWWDVNRGFLFCFIS